MPVDGDDRVLGQSFDQLDLVGLVGKHGLGVGPAEVFPLEGEASADGLPHQFLDLFQVFRSEGPGDLKVVVEPVLDGRADAHLGFWE